MKCPNCGYTNEPRAPRWLYSLRYMARYSRPMFAGALQDNHYRTDENLTKLLADGLIEMVNGEGFVITEAGREVAFKGATNQ